MLWPNIESQFKLWSSSTAEGRDGVTGEHLTEIAVMMRAKFRNYLLAIVEKLADNVSTLYNLIKIFRFFMEDLFNIGNMLIDWKLHDFLG